MPRIRHFRVFPVALMSLGFGAPEALALINLNEGRTRITGTSTFNVGYDSNLFANSTDSGDAVYSWDLSADATRHAGIIGFNATVGVNATNYGKYTGENFRNPRINATFTKGSGRTTGVLKLGAARQSRADTAANLRNESWVYDLGLNATYPVLRGRYSVAGSMNYTFRDFADNSVLVDLKSLSAGMDLLYILSDRHNVMAGYRIRKELASSSQSNIDHSFTAGVNGRIIYGITGQIRAGYVIRNPQDSAAGANHTYRSWTTAGSASWALNKRIDFAGQLNKDFSTTSTNISVDTIAAQLVGNYRFSSRMSFTSGLTWTSSRFLGSAGLGRKDTAWGWNVGASRSFNQYFKVQFKFTSTNNSSNEAFSTYRREFMTLSAITQL